MLISPYRTARFIALAIGLAVLLLLPIVGPAFSVRAATTPTIVSLTFDDSDEDQYTNALPALESHDMHGTFYAISGYVGVNSGYLTVPQLQAMYAAGNEIGGHTVLHPNLTQISTAEATREICDSRDTLLNWGFPVTDFAYPYSASSPTVEGIVKQCGYNSAREDGDITSPYGCVSGCPMAETIPPKDPYNIRAPQSFQDYWSLSQIEGEVTQAEDNGGGWTVLVFHHICDNACDSYSVTPENFNALLSWLQTQNVSVETVAQVIGGAVQPAVNAPQVPPAPPGTNGVTNPSLETADPYSSGTPYCWSTTASAADTASFAETSSAHTGSVAETVTMSSYTSGNAALVTTQDLGQCAPSVVAGDAYLVSAWYQSTTPTRFVFWYRDSNGGWHSWTKSPQFAAASSWTQANWVTPAMPADATALSFGLDIEAVGTLTTDDYSLMDSGGPPSTPTVSLTGPAAGSTLSGQVSFTATASSPVGISKVSFLVNGVVVATSTTSPYTATWNSATVGDGPVTITAQATDAAGDSSVTPGQADTISNAASRNGNLLANGTLATNTGGGSTPDCWHESATGTNTPAWSYTTGGPGGANAENVTISSYTSGSAQLVTTQNTSACSPRVTAGSTYTLGAWYASTQPTHILAYYLNSSGTWTYWTESPAFAASATGAQAAWTTAAVPAGATALSFGLSLAAAGSLTTTDYTMTSGAPATPTVSLTGPAAGSTLSGQVSFTATASSPVGISKVSFLVNGVVVATSTTSPYTATWNSATVGDGPVTITAQATDAAGDSSVTPGQADTISNAASRNGNLLANGTLATNTGGGSTPDCWHESATGTNTPAWSYTTGGPGGANAENVTISSYTSGSAQLVTTQNTSACSPRVTAGSTYTLGAWYESTQPTHILAYYLNSSGTWTYWTESPAFAASATGAQAAWTTAAVPAGATALSFGLSLAAAGSLTTTDYTMTSGAPATPTVSLTGPAAGSTLSGQVSFTATASSPVGISKVSFLVNGVVVATSTTSPYTATWNSATVGDGPVTITAQATDAAGDSSVTPGQADTISNAASRNGNLLANGTLATNTGGGSTPDCWHESATGTNTPAWSYTTGGPGGANAENVTISSYTSGSAQLVTTQNTSACSPRVTAGSTYTLGAWYESTQPTHILAYYLNSSGTWTYWTESPAFAASATGAQAAWTTAAVPAGATALSFGLSLAAAGSLTTTDYTMTSGAPATPTVSLTGPAAGSTLSGQVSFTATASSPVGISKVSFLVNGVVVATSTTSPYTATWNSATVGDGPVTITAQATDAAGDSSVTPGQADTISNAASRNGNLLANGTLATNTGGGSTPDCWHESATGTNTPAWSYTTGGPGGANAENVTISSYTSGSAQLVTTQNTSACSPRVTAGSTYTLGAWYESTQPTHILAYYLNSSGTWTYWTESPAFAASATGAQAAWTTAAVPAGATALSFGLSLAAAGSLTTTDYTMTSG